MVVEHVAASACDVWLVGSRRGARGRTSGQCGTEGAVVPEAVAAQPMQKGRTDGRGARLGATWRHLRRGNHLDLDDRALNRHGGADGSADVARLLAGRVDLSLDVLAAAVHGILHVQPNSQ